MIDKNKKLQDIERLENEIRKANSNIDYLRNWIEGLGCAISELEQKVDVLEMLNKTGEYRE